MEPEMWKASFYAKHLSLLQNISNTDFYTTLSDGYLVKSDRASMMHSLELRAPFLDHNLIEFSFQKVPDTLKANGSERKLLLKRLGRRVLPPQFDINRKQGFSLPLNSWFKDGWGDFMKEVLMETDENLFDRKAIMEIFRLQEKGYSNADRLFALTFFELWRREYKVTL